MFDSKAEISFPARVAATGGEQQELVLRWPTDEEWIARAKARKITIRKLGRGVSETIPPAPSEADAALYRAIAVNGAPEMTPAEAVKLFEMIGVCDVTDVRLDGTGAFVSMMILTGPVEHQLKIPSADQVITFRRSAYKLLDLPFNQQQLTLTPEAGARLYDQCSGKSASYANGIPATHKDAAVRAVIEYVDNNLGPRRDDANF